MGWPSIAAPLGSAHCPIHIWRWLSLMFNFDICCYNHFLSNWVYTLCMPGEIVSFGVNVSRQSLHWIDPSSTSFGLSALHPRMFWFIFSTQGTIWMNVFKRYIFRVLSQRQAISFHQHTPKLCLAFFLKFPKRMKLKPHQFACLCTCLCPLSSCLAVHIIILYNVPVKYASNKHEITYEYVH